MRPPHLHWHRSTHFLAVVVGLGVALSCSEHELQTARLDKDFQTSTGGLGAGGANAAFIDCSRDVSSATVNFDNLNGALTDVQDSPLVSSTYGALAGPGIYVAPRDVYQLYINGVLVAQSDEPRTSEFTALTLLPGDNTIAVAVAANAGTPAALVHISELAREYASDGSWKVSASPENGWAAPAFDDSAWREATELGDFGEVPGCDPTSDFPKTSAGLWIGPPAGETGPIVLRRTIRIAPEGFGEATTGGGTTEPVLVTTPDELEAALDSAEPKVLILAEGTYDMRTDARDQEVCVIECPEEPGAFYNQILVGDSTCDDPLITLARNEESFDVGSNTTLVGLGRGASLRGLTLVLDSNENVIIRNVAFFDVNPQLREAGDALSLIQPNGVWIDHSTTKWISDGFVDARENSKNITLSFMRFDGENPDSCQNRHGWTSELTDSTVTVHHSLYDNIRTRGPFVTGPTARVHIFNNLYTNVLDWAVGARCEAEVLLEGSVFDNVEAATYFSGCTDLGPALLLAPAGSNLYRDESNVHLGGDGSEPRAAVTAPPYEYSLDTAAEALPLVTSRAGTGGPWALPLTRD